MEFLRDRPPRNAFITQKCFNEDDLIFLSFHRIEKIIKGLKKSNKNFFTFQCRKLFGQRRGVVPDIRKLIKCFLKERQCIRRKPACTALVL